MHSTHEAERLSATPTPLVGCTHDSVLVRAATAAWHCSRLGGAQQLGEGRGALPGPVRVVHKTLCLCAAGDAGRVRRCLGEARVAALPSARPAALEWAARVWGTAVNVQYLEHTRGGVPVAWRGHTSSSSPMLMLPPSTVT